MVSFIVNTSHWLMMNMLYIPRQSYAPLTMIQFISCIRAAMKAASLHTWRENVAYYAYSMNSFKVKTMSIVSR